MHLPLLAIAAPAASALKMGKNVISEGNDAPPGMFGILLGKSFNPGINCLGHVQSSSGPVTGLGLQGKLGLGDLKDVLAFLKKAILERNGRSQNKLVLDHPDERVLSDFLRDCGFSDSEIETIKKETKTGEGEYSLEILFALLQRQPSDISDPGTEPANTSGGKAQLGLSDIAGLNGILNELRSLPNVPERTSEKLILNQDKLKPDLQGIAQALKEIQGKSFHAVPLEDRHKSMLLELLQRFGLDEKTAQDAIADSGLEDNQLSVEKLITLFDKASKEVNRLAVPRDQDKINSRLEKLLSTLRTKIDTEPKMRSDLDLISTWEDQWLERYNKESPKTDSGKPAPFDMSAVNNTALLEQNISIPEGNDTLDYVSNMKLHNPFDSQLSAGLQPKGALHQDVRPAPLLNPGLVYPQVLDGVLKSVRLKEDKLVIRLVPPELGEMKINLAMKDGQLNATFFIDDRRVKEMMESSLPQLRTALSEQGIQVGECNVELNQDFRHFSGNSDRHTSNSTGRFSGEPGVTVRQEMDLPYTRTQSLEGIDLFA